jgi:hypothetical protein
MANWYAAGDETGRWDIVSGRFSSLYIGVGWALGSGQGWQRALDLAHNGSTRLKTFITPFSERFPTHAVTVENQYHVKNVWDYCREEGIKGDIALDTPHADPVVEALRSDAEWLLKDSGLAVLAAGDTESRAKSAGLGASGDHMRERARAMASLLGVVLPFIPDGDSLHLLPAGRNEDTESDILRASAESRPLGDRVKEPYRDFLGRLREDLDRIARSYVPLVTSGKVISDFRFQDRPEFSDIDPIERREIHSAARKEFPLLHSKSGDDVRSAMLAIADLAAAFSPRESGKLRLVVPDAFKSNLWVGNLGEVIHAFH